VNLRDLPPRTLIRQHVAPSVAPDVLGATQEVGGRGERQEPPRHDEAVSPVVALAAQHGEAPGPRETVLDQAGHLGSGVLHQQGPWQAHFLDGAPIGVLHLPRCDDLDHLS